ncbi:MAG: hypothetical protein HN736_05140 [Anaerolineae bacterium]|jgi:F0F1-type ATP synthase membrane subunit b/b'|nr:hypothetical protein [Anaerolineae bacterium]MBT3713223.1 hypothetical protein [Anaerolineae bacterium]MBT4312538.1 hypothetical protein [Anaerolineae bacterium]MBT4457661.1 hypothetical protein [Anaerolineae bacterium]MBT4841156.1 hypothetical protein [Anaerolineae bacterium]
MTENKRKEMIRQILGGTLIALSAILLILSLIGIGAAWYYNEPLTKETASRYSMIDDELAQAESALKNAQEELKRALRIVESAEASLESLSEQTTMAKELLDKVTDILDKTITPGLEASKEKVNEAQKTLDDLRSSIETLNKIPFVNLELPDDEILNFFVEITDSLEAEITQVEDVADQASVFLSDTSYLLGGDLLETKENIKELQKVITEYEEKIGIWREELAMLKAETPDWIDRASIILTIFLLWFGFSQFGLLLHGLTLWQGEDPVEVLRSKG